MIIVCLNGGLGNQLFQYALGRHLSIINNTELFLDVSMYNILRPYKFELDRYNIIGKIIKCKRLSTLNDTKSYPLFSDIKIIKERGFEYNEGLLKKGGDIYLKGYWQSEKYFNNIREIILTDISLKPEIEKLAQECNIQRNKSVGVHIRRGDYTKKKSLTIHGLIEVSYYKEAVNIINKKIGKCTYYIFSDDIRWVKKYMNIFPDAIFIVNKNRIPAVDLWLMSVCEHNIIANSTFSWWGAWLNKNPDKIVICPSKWFTDEKINIADLIPNKWIKI